MADLLSYGIDVDAAVYQLRDVGLPDLVRRSKRYTEYLAVLLEPVCDRIDVATLVAVHEEVPRIGVRTKDISAAPALGEFRDHIDHFPTALRKVHVPMCGGCFGIVNDHMADLNESRWVYLVADLHLRAVDMDVHPFDVFSFERKSTTRWEWQRAMLLD